MNTQLIHKFVQGAAALMVGALLCLAPQAFAQSVSNASAFDHDRTGYVLKDVHTTLKCEQCHIDGIFKNTPKECSGCHATGTRVGATPRPINHVPTTSPCDTCHISAVTFLVKSYKHFGITGNCSTCHNGAYLSVVGKSMNHFPTQQPCELCHTNTSSFLSFRMDHTGITSNCFQCHGGPEAGAMTYPNVVAFPTATHISVSANADCNACHSNFITFLGAGFNHAPPLAACGTCHRGQSPGAVSINTATHIPQNQGDACDTCHTIALTLGYKTFVNSPVFHVSSVGTATPIPTFPTTCGACHNGSYTGAGALGKPATHIPTSLDCASAGCHTAAATSNFTTFLGVVLSHVPSFYASFPADLAVATPTCSSCHNGTSALGKPATHLTTSLDCNSCHLIAQTLCPNCTNFLGAVFNHTTGGSPYPTNGFPQNGPASPTCGSCHLTGLSGAKMKPTGHVATTQDCLYCHTASSTNCGTTGTCTTFLGAAGAAPHTAPPGFLNGSTTCVQCHNGVQATGLSSNANHIPIGSAGCDQCHPAYDGTTSVNFGTGSTTTSGIGFAGSVLKYGMNHAAPGLTGRCDSCHNGSYSGQGISGAVPKVSNHIPTTIISTAANTDCTTCHTLYPTLASVPVSVMAQGAGAWLTETMNHNNAQGGAPNYCVTCHLSSATYLSSKIQKKNHNGASTSKDCSSSSCHKPLGKTGTAYSNWN